MYENKFDQAVDEVSDCYGLDWNDASKVRLFARFCKTNGVSFQEFENFLERQAMEEQGGGDEEADENEE